MFNTNQNQNKNEEFFKAVRALDSNSLEQIIQMARRLNMTEQDIQVGLQFLSQIKNNPR